MLSKDPVARAFKVSVEIEELFVSALVGGQPLVS